jgi:hypothetical protein
MVSTDRQTTKVIAVKAMVSTDRQTTTVIAMKPWYLQTDRKQKLLQ